MLKTKRILLFLLLLMIIAGTMTGCNVKKTKSFQCVEDFEQARIGILTGSSHDNTAKEFFPKASRVYFNNMSDMILAVEQGKIDGYLEDAPFVAPLNWEGIALKCVDGSVGQVSNGFLFPQGESTQLREQINEFIGEAKSDGTIEQLTQKWLGKTEPTEHPDYSTLTGENGTIHLAVSVDGKPMLYQNADGFTGFEMELLTAFAQHYGYKFDIEVVPFESIIAGISANKYDMGASALNITDERKESVDFSDAYNTFEVVIVAKSGESKTYDTLSDLENATLGIITGTNYDNVAKEKFPDAERIEEFGRKNRISQRTIYNIQAYIEEMCVQIILPQMKAPFETLVTIEYSEEKDNADVVVRYSGESFDPLQTDNELSLLMAKNATENIVYSYDSERALCNRVDAQI